MRSAFCSKPQVQQQKPTHHMSHQCGESGCLSVVKKRKKEYRTDDVWIKKRKSYYILLVCCVESLCSTFSYFCNHTIGVTQKEQIQSLLFICRLLQWQVPEMDVLIWILHDHYFSEKEKKNFIELFRKFKHNKLTKKKSTIIQSWSNYVQLIM